MPKQIAFSIYDSKAECFSPPFFRPAPGQAIRDFTDLANDPNTTIGKHPSDYGLYRIGEFDDGNGSITGDRAAMLMVSGNEVVAGSDGKGLRVERA